MNDLIEVHIDCGAAAMVEARKSLRGIIQLNDPLLASCFPSFPRTYPDSQ